MKIVVNSCYGGFGLSPLGYQHYLKLAGKDCFFYVQTKYKHDGGKDKYEKRSLEELDNEIGVMFCFTEDQGDSFFKFPKDGGYFYCNNLERNDPLLVRTVEELGEKANGRLAKLRIAEIPDGIEWHIDEYDGIESVHENHRSW